MKNKNILIVGGTSGIGFYLSKKLAKSNNVSVLGRNKQVLKNLKKVFRPLTLKSTRSSLLELSFLAIFIGATLDQKHPANPDSRY